MSGKKKPIATCASTRGRSGGGQASERLKLRGRTVKGPATRPGPRPGHGAEQGQGRGRERGRGR
eukprot:13529165-Alexandrium_andersonii.AAC.1